MRENMQRCFPDKSVAWLKEKEKQFYRYLGKLLIETLWAGHLSDAEISKRVKFENIEVLNDLEKEGQSGIIVMGHCGNWELGALGLPPLLTQRCIGVYKALKNKRIDVKIRESRGRTGLELWSTEKVVYERREIFKQPSFLVLIFDQNPSKVHKAFWIDFFGNLLPWFSGPEFNARRNNVPLIYAKMYMLEDGNYSVQFVPIEYNEEPGNATEQMVALLESQIIEKPEHWLWTHKRWKRAHLFEPERHIRIDRKNLST